MNSYLGFCDEHKRNQKRNGEARSALGGAAGHRVLFRDTAWRGVTLSDCRWMTKRRQEEFRSFSSFCFEFDDIFH
jgi:hypothetical protein